MTAEGKCGRDQDPKHAHGKTTEPRVTGRRVTAMVQLLTPSGAQLPHTEAGRLGCWRKYEVLRDSEHVGRMQRRRLGATEVRVFLGAPESSRVRVWKGAAQCENKENEVSEF